MTAKKFKNFSNEDFTWKFDGVPYTFQAGETMFMEDYKADHFAKHLVDREMNRMNVEKGLHQTKNEIPTSNATERAKLEALCFPSNEEVSSAQALNLNEEVKVKKAKKSEPEFPDLNSDLPKVKKTKHEDPQ